MQTERSIDEAIAEAAVAQGYSQLRPKPSTGGPLLP